MTTNKGREIISKINMLLKNAHAENIKIDCAEYNSNILKSRLEVMYSFETLMKRTKTYIYHMLFLI